MRRFDYVQPSSVQETVGILDREGEDALLLAGGTALVLLLGRGLLRPRYVVDLGGLAELSGVAPEDDGGVRIGARTRLSELQGSGPALMSHQPLRDAAAQVASVRVRNVATVGGSVCYGEPQTDVPPALIALGAQAVLVGPRGRRSVEMQQFYVGPYETVLERGELLTELLLPPRPVGAGGCHVKFTIGPRENRPVVNVSVALSVDPATGRCGNMRIAMGAVGPVPILATGAMQLLEGEIPDGRLLAEAARLASEQADPVDDLRGSVWYKRRIIKVLVEKAVKCALERAKSGPA
jgi:carbon-monoxide dehydrogenase medium subunit